MGDAKRKLDELGTTRKIHFDGRELTDLLNWLLADATKVDKAKKMPTAQRRSFRSALRQMGILDIYKDAKRGVLQPGDLPKSGVKTMTVDAIDVMGTFFSAFEFDYRELLDIGEIEERLADAKAGIYELPAEDKSKEDETTAPPPLSVVPDVASEEVSS